MSKESLYILFIALLISASGILINLIKKGRPEKIKLIKDDATLFWFRVLVPFALIISLLIYFSSFGQITLPSYLLYTGHLFIILGLLTRWIAIISLGNAFTVKVSILENHRLKTDGLYNKIRHPSYTGLLLYYLGLGLIMHNWICIALLIIGPAFAVFNRIQTEEAVLSNNFAQEYEHYKKHSWRLFPYIY